MSIFTKQEEQKESAVRPDAFFNLPSFMRDKEMDKKGLTDEERVLASGKETQFWKALQGRIDRIIRELEDVNEEAIAQGADLAEIGKNTVVINLTKGVLRKTFNIVEDAYDAVTEHGK
jgi:hypothetical protein